MVNLNSTWPILVLPRCDLVWPMLIIPSIADQILTSFPLTWTMPLSVACDRSQIYYVCNLLLIELSVHRRLIILGFELILWEKCCQFLAVICHGVCNICNAWITHFFFSMTRMTVYLLYIYIFIVSAFVGYTVYTEGTNPLYWMCVLSFSFYPLYVRDPKPDVWTLKCFHF